MSFLWRHKATVLYNERHIFHFSYKAVWDFNLEADPEPPEVINGN